MLAYCRALSEQEDLQNVPLSVDTFYAEVAQRAVAAGAHMVNDVSGGLMDPHMHSQVRLRNLYPIHASNTQDRACLLLLHASHWLQASGMMINSSMGTLRTR